MACFRFIGGVLSFEFINWCRYLELCIYDRYLHVNACNRVTEKNLKVLQICAAYKPAFIYGGPTMSLAILNEQLIRAGITTEVYVTTANGKTELPVLAGATMVIDGVPVTYFKRITKDHSHFSPSLLKRLVENGT